MAIHLASGLRVRMSESRRCSRSKAQAGTDVSGVPRTVMTGYIGPPVSLEDPDNAFQESGTTTQICAAPGRRQDFESDLRGVEPRNRRREASGARRRENARS